MLIVKYYERLWKQLQREGCVNAIKNKYLNCDVFVVKNESDKKTTREALHNWKSTLAVKHLRKVIENAKPLKDQPFLVPRKEGDQKRNGYKIMILLFYDFRDNEKPYLNFTVKLTVGVKASGKHVQYCVNKVDTK